jgi:hypothetical protein
VKRMLLVMVAILLAAPAAQAKFTLGGSQPPLMNIGGQVKFGPDLMLGAAEGEPFVSFNNTTASLFLTGTLSEGLNWMVHPSMAGGKFTLLECFALWEPADAFGVLVGQAKAPFGRVYNSSAARLLFMTRNPLIAFAPKYQLGVMPVITLPGRYQKHRWAQLSAGVYNGDGPNTANQDPGLMYAASVDITPLGTVPAEESANKGYPEPALSLLPGFWTNTVTDTLGMKTTTTAYGGHAAFRWDYLALDAAYYMKSVDAPEEDAAVTTDGLTVQGGYAFAGKYEPIARFTMVGLDDATTTIEAGFNWYFNSYASRLGLNYARVQPPEGDATQTVRLYYEFQF